MIHVAVEVARGAFQLDVRLDADARVAGLFGPSGCGKTTLLHAIAGLIRPMRGEILVDGETLFSSSRGMNLRPEARRIGMVFQEDRLFPNRNVRANLMASPRARNGPAGGPTLDEVVSLLGLDGLLDRPVQQISGGERRRVAIGRAILSRPRLLILDEPLTGLDAALRRRVLAYLLRMKASLDTRMLYVTHTIADMLAIAETMALLDAGRVTAVGPPGELLDRAVDVADAGPLETTWRGAIELVDAASATAEIRCGTLSVNAPLDDGRAGDEAFVSIGAHEALLAVGDVPKTSARNALPGRVVSLATSASRVLVNVDVGQPLWVEITPAAADELAIAPGRDVHVLIKTRSIRATTIGSHTA